MQLFCPDFENMAVHITSAQLRRRRSGPQRPGKQEVEADRLTPHPAAKRFGVLKSSLSDQVGGYGASGVQGQRQLLNPDDGNSLVCILEVTCFH